MLFHPQATELPVASAKSLLAPAQDPPSPFASPSYVKLLPVGKEKGLASKLKGFYCFHSLILCTHPRWVSRSNWCSNLTVLFRKMDANEFTQPQCITCWPNHSCQQIGKEASPADRPTWEQKPAFTLNPTRKKNMQQDDACQICDSHTQSGSGNHGSLMTLYPSLH